MSLRVKILLSFLILVIMLFIAGMWSIYEFYRIGASVETILEKNYQKVDSAKRIKYLFEKQITFVLNFIINKNIDDEVLTKNNSEINRIMNELKSDTQSEDEKKLLNLMSEEYHNFENIFEELSNIEKSNSIEWFYQKPFQNQSNFIEAVDKFITLNNSAISKEFITLRQQANRSIMPGLVAIVSALFFTFLFNYFLNYYLIKPLVSITNSVKKMTDTSIPFEIKVETNDELAKLAEAINSLSSRVNITS